MYRILLGLSLGIVLGFTHVQSTAQTFGGGGGLLLDDGTQMYYTIAVTGVVPATMNANYGLETVCIDLTHTWNDDLVISLIAPDGTEFDLSYRHGGDSDNYTNTCFNTDAADALSSTTGPFTGTFKPDGAMASVNNGQNANGTWTLHINDTYPFADSGELLGWSITFGNNPATPFPFTGAVLPLVVIHTQGGINDEPKTAGTMKVIRNANGALNFANDPANIYNGPIGIELRGNSSQGMPKKSYLLETRLADSSANDVELLDMPSENDWVLIANYSDKTLLRNYMSQSLFRQMGHYAPRMQLCEVLMNGEYQGIYLLGEKIKRGNDRVDIASIDNDDLQGDSLQGGYMFKIDWDEAGDVFWTSQFPTVNSANLRRYIVEYPRAEDIQSEQLLFIQGYVDAFEASIANDPLNDTVDGFRQYVDEMSFIDMMILNEFTKNIDGYRLSTFLHKPRHGKITAGPPWDYDLSWGNADYIYGNLQSGWNYETQADYTDQMPFWWSKFLEDTIFNNRLRCRWNELRESVLDGAYVKYQIDSLVAVMGTSVDLNFTKWPILGQYVWPNPGPIPADYSGEIANLHDWVDLRLAWLDNHWTGTCAPTVGIQESESAIAQLDIYPNPSNGAVKINGWNGPGYLTVTDQLGRTVFQSNYNGVSAPNLETLTSGSYRVSIQRADQRAIAKLIIIH